MPKPTAFPPDETTTEVLALVAEHYAGHFGDLNVSALPSQGAGATVSTHSSPKAAAVRHLSGRDDRGRAVDVQPYRLYLVGLCFPAGGARAEAAWHTGHAPLNAVENFIRQILGWREFVRGIRQCRTMPP